MRKDRCLLRLGQLLLVFMFACSSPSGPQGTAGGGGRYYGGIFNANEGEELRGLFPLSLTQASAHRMAAQLFEGLVGFDQSDLSIQPALAVSWSVDGSGTVYTFNLRKGVRFHDDPCFPDGRGRELTAQDVVHCFTELCTFSERNQMFWLFQDRVLGANAQLAATAGGGKGPGVKGLEAIDPHTVRITLAQPSTGFLQVLAHQGCWIYPAEAVAHYGDQVLWHPVGTGPFRLKSFQRNVALILERNPTYWGVDEHGNALPFLDGVRYTFVKDKGVEFKEFEQGHLSVMFELPLERTAILRDTASLPYVVQTIPGLSVQFYGFDRRIAPFGDVRVRRAISMAIDRNILVDSVLGGLAVVARHGVVPPGFSGYPYASVPPTRYDPEVARHLLAEAGYPDGKGCPPIFLQVNNGGFGYVEVAAVVQSMIERNLGVRVVTTVLSSDQHLDRVEGGKARFWREGWVADHPDPENFLALFHGRSVPSDTTQPSFLNSTRYMDARFDSLFTAAEGNRDGSGRLLQLALAERRVMEEAVVVPLYHERTVRLLQPWVRDLPINGLEYRLLRAVWFDPAARQDQ